MIRRSALAGLALLALGACSSGDRYAPKLGVGRPVARIGGPVVLIERAGTLAVADAGTHEVRLIGESAEPSPGLQSIARRKLGGDAVTEDDEGLIIGRSGRIERADGTVITRGWSGPAALAVDGRNRLWAIDAGGDGESPRIARGRTTDRAKRNRLATRLPARSDPVAAAASETEVYVCDAATRTVLRFHVGLDDVARRRGPVKGLRCQYDIAVLGNGSIVTAVGHRILLYPKR